MHEIIDTIIEAIELMESQQLVWSNDFEVIRPHLASMLQQEIKYGNPSQQAIDIANELITLVENDFTVG